MATGPNITLDATFAGFLFGHNGAVTSIIGSKTSGNEYEDTLLVSGSRDKTLILWDLTKKTKENCFGEPFKCMTGHSHFVTDLDITNDNLHVISSSWDKTIRIWDLRSSKSVLTFTEGNAEIETCCFSSDNLKIYSGGHDKFISLWNVKGQRKGKTNEEAYNHTQWVTKIRYSASQKNEYFASVGRDGRLNIWTGTSKTYASIQAHENYINALALSLNGQFIVTGGKDCCVKVWDYNDLSKPYVEYKTESEVNALAFNLQYQLVAAATDKSIKIWDINSKTGQPLLSITPERNPKHVKQENQKIELAIPKCTAIAWSANLKKLYVGCSDGAIRVYNIDLRNS
jgi:guanine nucleotide-binding protein subunit beta-2-like 1 protein